MKFGGRVVNDVVLFNTEVTVETRDGKTATGLGSMTMGNVWGWPSQAVDGATTLKAMVLASERMAAAAQDYNQCVHPIEIVHDLSQHYQSLSDGITAELGVSESIPRLAQLVSASPIDAAIHDAFGKANGINAFNALGEQFANRDLAHYLGADFAGEYLDRYTSRAPKSKMPLYHLVGALDPLTAGDVAQRVNDGLPETLGEWIIADGLTHLKLKLAGDDLDWDVQRVVSVESVAVEAQAQRGCTQWYYSCDFNEKCQSVQYVLDFLARLESIAPAALARVQYIEQPTHRDLKANPENKMHQAAQIKPVVIDESLIDLESLLLSREQGYSGVALKACKGHTEALLMGAAAQKYNLFLCVQDLTCVGISFLHSSAIAARIPTVAAIEGNGRQYCPAGNRAWSERFPGMFEITDGTVHTAELNGFGLGY
jgi:L-alanine-DL-glutamate epimerase-like enolase superfamily enzyme